METRAAVFTSEPQAVEVYQSGAWWPGELLGWRHDAEGGCQVWVRVALGGSEESAWTDLKALRLPERGQAATSSPLVSTPARDHSETASLPRVRDRSVAPTRPTVGARSGGRRRAPEEGSPAPRTAPSVGAAGRHRAPADLGRHRAADTGLLPAVTVGDRDTATAQRPALGAGRTVPAPRPGRSAESVAPTDARSASVDLQPDLLTRPMRLSDLGPSSRRPRLDGSLAGV